MNNLISTCVQSNQPLTFAITRLSSRWWLPECPRASLAESQLADTVRVQFLREFKARTGTVAAHVHVRIWRSFLRGRAHRAVRASYCFQSTVVPVRRRWLFIPRRCRVPPPPPPEQLPARDKRNRQPRLNRKRSGLEFVTARLRFRRRLVFTCMHPQHAWSSSSLHAMPTTAAQRRSICIAPIL